MLTLVIVYPSTEKLLHTSFNRRATAALKTKSKTAAGTGRLIPFTRRVCAALVVALLSVANY